MKLAIVSGGFDPVHIGHLKLFEIARSKADSLFVILNATSLNHIKKLTKKNQLQLEKINSYSEDYAKTLLDWKKNFFKAWDNIAPLGFSESFKRMWEFYLSYCEAGFKAKNIDLIQFSMSNR